MNVIKRKLLLIALLLAAPMPPASADAPATGQSLIEDFTMHPETRWRFFTDQVMGGVSTGGVAFLQEDSRSFARMTGHVSTANRGGFIQMRLDLADPPPKGTSGVRLLVRGNVQRYFVHLRTRGTLLPWQYYQASFDVSENWSEVHLPFDVFAPSGSLFPALAKPQSLRSVAVVAYGRDHDARIDVSDVGFY